MKRRWLRKSENRLLLIVVGVLVLTTVCLIIQTLD